MPRFSVIIPVHNRPGFVRQALESVLAQTFTDREIIVVDDGSTDETPAVVRGFGRAIRVITLAGPQGCEVARNAGAAAAEGEYLAFLDSDDVWYPWALATYDFVLMALGKPALLVSRYAYFSVSPPELPAPGGGDAVEVVVFEDYLARDRRIASTASMIVVRTDVFFRVGGFRQSTALTFNMSDHDFLLRVGCEGPAVLLERPCAVAYREHDTNSVRDISRVVVGMLNLIRAERKGLYPGGRTRCLDRRAAIGGPTQYWSRRALNQGHVWLAVRLLSSGGDMVLAKLFKTLRTSIRGLKPATRLERSKAPSSAAAGPGA